jgi:hypothetical protein
MLSKSSLPRTDALAFVYGAIPTANCPLPTASVIRPAFRLPPSTCPVPKDIYKRNNDAEFGWTI